MSLEIKDKIITQLIDVIMHDSCSDYQLLSVVGSYNDTMTDVEVLEHLEGYNGKP